MATHISIYDAPSDTMSRVRVGSLMSFAVLTATGFVSHDIGAAMRVRVTAPSNIEARVDRSAVPSRAMVRGTLRDDVGNPIASAHVAIEFHEGDGRGPAITLPVPLHCPGDVSPAPHLAPDEYVIDTNRAGAFCFESALGIERGVMKLQFAGDLDHDATATDVPIDLSRPAATLEFDPEPKVLSLDRPVLFVTLRVSAPALSKEGWRVAVRDERQQMLGSADVDSDGSARVELRTQAMEAPGPGELRASLEGAPVFSAPIAVPVERHARVQIEVGASADGVPEDGIALLAKARWSRGPVPIGSIEARLGELSVGMGAVRNGEARVTATFASPRTSTLLLRAAYVPAAPWWEPGAPSTISVTVREATRWRRVALLAFALALLAWVLREAYDFRPFRRGRAMAAPARAVEASSRTELVRPRAANEGWAGAVVDAHDGSPVEGAVVTVLLPGFPSAAGPTGTQVLAELRVDAAGRFALGNAAFPRGALLRASGPSHADIEMPLPAPSELSIALVSRRRRLLDRLVAFAAREWGADNPRREPTPDQVARKAARVAISPTGGRAKQIEAFARATESAAFGPDGVDASTETEVLALEPR